MNETHTVHIPCESCKTVNDLEVEYNKIITMVCMKCGHKQVIKVVPKGDDTNESL